MAKIDSVPEEWSRRRSVTAVLGQRKESAEDGSQAGLPPPRSRSPSASDTSNTDSSSTPTIFVATAPPIKEDIVDLERGIDTHGNASPVDDPYGLREGLQTEAQIKEAKSAVDPRRGRRRRARQVARYQRKQNNLIEYLLKPMAEHTEDAKLDEEAARIPVKIAIYASLLANLTLCFFQMYAAISSLSLSLLATGIDSIFDIGSNILLFWLHRKSARLDSSKWPVGGSRLETIGNIIYGFLMGSVNLVVIVESVRSLVTRQKDDLQNFHLPSILSVSAALGVKLLLFLYCFSLRSKSSQVRVLWEDHRNDLWINSFGILMSTGGSKIKWFLDPMGAIIIATAISLSWSRTVYSEFGLLAGKSAPHEFLQLLIYKSATFDKGIEKVDTVRAYHSGPEYYVELDVVMDGNTPLWKAHDLGQALQDKLELLPNVERAFVHIDHEYTHIPEHRRPPPPSRHRQSERSIQTV